MSGVDELVAFVRACLDDDERVAQEAIDQGGIGRAGEAYWMTVEGQPGLIGDKAGNVVAYSGMPSGWSPSRQQAEHIVRWCPASVRAEIEAKRRILAEVEYEIHDAEKRETGDGLGLSHTMLGLLAQPYAGREGWRKEWAA